MAKKHRERKRGGHMGIIALGAAAAVAAGIAILSKPVGASTPPPINSNPTVASLSLSAQYNTIATGNPDVLTVNAYDSNGNGVASTAISLSSGQTGTTNGSGQAQFSLVFNTAGTYTIYAVA